MKIMSRGGFEHSVVLSDMIHVSTKVNFAERKSITTNVFAQTIKHSASCLSYTNTCLKKV